jgi:small-conductance mechanosensitive channel
VVKVELSKEEEIRLYNLSLVPAGVILVAFLVSFVHLMRTDVLKTMWDYLLFATPFWTAIIGSIFLTFEVLYSRKTKSSIRFYAKRLLGRIFLLAACMLSLLAIVGIFYPILSPIAGDYSILYTGVLWALLFFIVARTFRRTINKLTDGHW